MQFSGLDLLDDDPLGLFEDIKTTKKRNRRRKRQTKSIYDDLDESKENEDIDESNKNHSNSFMKPPSKSPLSKTVTFNEEEINIPDSSGQSHSDSKELTSDRSLVDFRKNSISYQSLSENAIPVPNESTSGINEQEAIIGNSPNYSTDFEIKEHLDVALNNISNDISGADSNTNNNREYNIDLNESQSMKSDFKSYRDHETLAEKKETLTLNENESAPFGESHEQNRTETESINHYVKNNNTATQQTSLEHSALYSRQNSPDANDVVTPCRPIPRRKRMNSGSKADAVSLSAQLNDIPVSAVVYPQGASGEYRMNEGSHDVVIGPIRKVTANMAIRRPSSCHSISRYGLRSTSTPDSGELDGEANAATIRMMAYKNWYQRHLKSAQQNRMDSLKKDAMDTKKQREDMERIKSNEQAFEAWRAKKRAFFRDQLRQKRAQEEERQRKLDEANERKASSSKVSSNEFTFELDQSSAHPRNTTPAFEIWKSHKDCAIKKQYRENLHRERTLEQTKAQMEAEKRAQSEKAFATWKARKEAELREALYNEKRKQSEEEKKREEEARLKLEKAAEAYYQWELRKVASVDNLRQSLSRESITERFPWRPPSARPTVTR